MRLGLNLGSSRRRHLVQPGAGPRSRIKERLTRYARLPIQTLNIRTPTVEVLRMMAELAL